jgi:drug/metabolite transporter (DMT)-like permease
MLLQEYVGVVAALGASVLFSASRIFVRLGLKAGYVEQAHFISVLMNNLILWPLAILYTFATNISLNLSSLTIFFIAGFFTTGLGRFLTFLTLNRLTATESAPFVSISPLFTSMMAVLFMNEMMTTKLLFGTILVVSGLLLISIKLENRNWFAFLVGVTGSFFLSVGEVLRKYGMVINPNPPLGAVVGSLAALALSPLYRYRTNIFKINKYFFWSGLSISFALLLVFVSYAMAPLVVAVPLINTSPLFTLCFGYLIARSNEELGLGITLGILIVTAGVIMIVI